eukprot:NODE_1693_length_908_cov_600.741560_g189_i1.p2 GENE.NODE_1693_length_908_cov_600.741560_g189_i1~~NODE_1693_length_908_cov_600.741560_g189_i1.p2  ORF type:complete len:260 (+),score=105.62 NODE_1693_length_908_cov_600.741560_g189_i1:52-780(+)
MYADGYDGYAPGTLAVQSPYGAAGTMSGNPAYGYPEGSTAYPAGPASYPTVMRPGYIHEKGIEDPWSRQARKYERWLDHPREKNLAEYYKPNKSLSNNPWLAPWTFPDGAPCFFCAGSGHRADIGMDHLSCRGCQSNKFYKPSKSAAPYCTECRGQGVWKQSYCISCGGKGLGHFYLPFACPKPTCKARARTNWEIELHRVHKHATKVSNPDQHRLTTQPFLMPVGRRWDYNVARDGKAARR